MRRSGVTTGKSLAWHIDACVSLCIHHVRCIIAITHHEHDSPSPLENSARVRIFASVFPYSTVSSSPTNIVRSGIWRTLHTSTYYNGNCCTLGSLVPITNRMTHTLRRSSARPAAGPPIDHRIDARDEKDAYRRLSCQRVMFGAVGGALRVFVDVGLAR